MEPRVVDNPDEQRYELRIGDDVAGEIRYHVRDDGKVALVHTEVDSEHKARGSATSSSKARSTTCASAGSSTA